MPEGPDQTVRASTCFNSHPSAWRVRPFSHDGAEGGDLGIQRAGDRAEARAQGPLVLGTTPPPAVEQSGSAGDPEAAGAWRRSPHSRQSRRPRSPCSRQSRRPRSPCRRQSRRHSRRCAPNWPRTRRRRSRQASRRRDLRTEARPPQAKTASSTASTQSRTAASTTTLVVDEASAPSRCPRQRQTPGGCPIDPYYTTVMACLVPLTPGERWWTPPPACVRLNADQTLFSTQ